MEAMATRGTNLSVTSVGVAAIVLVGAAVWFGVGHSVPPSAVESSASPDVFPGSSQIVTVHVSGSVLDPGLVAVPDGSRIADAVAAAGGATLDADLRRLNIAATVRDGDQIVVPSVADDPSQGASEPTKIDINTADATGLATLPGIGPVIAQRIVSYREQHGAFATIEDLLDVPGIGEAKLAAIRDAIGSS
ncbi:MAG: ComEA family DNA-binding protein [Acidimicrobiia bacterium]